MKLTTPAIASEPYVAAAPSLRISILLKAAIGKSCKLTDLFAPLLIGTVVCLFPFIKTKVLCVPRPLILIFETPSAPFDPNWFDSPSIPFAPGTILINSTILRLF